MKLSWTKGPISWIAALPEKQDPPNKIFKRTQPPSDAALVLLCKRLVEIGGDSAVVPFSDEEASQFFLEQSAVTPFSRIRFQRGRSGECHVNCALFWHKNKKRYHLATGYALSSDGRWRRHSWLINKNELIETTEKRAMYFGAILNDQQAEAFHELYSDYG